MKAFEVEIKQALNFQNVGWQEIAEHYQQEEEVA